MLFYLLNEELSPILSYAECANLKARSRKHDLKLEIYINGFSEKAPLLLSTILHYLKNITPTKEQFDLYKAFLARSYANMDKEMPFYQSFEIANNLLFNPYPKHDEELKALNEISYEEFLSFAEKLLKQAYIETMLSGNMTKDEAIKTWQTIKEELAYSPYPTQEHLKKRILVLPENEGPYKIHKQIESQGNVAFLILQEGPFSFGKSASSSLLGTILKEEFFTTLRTKQQTAYIAKSLSLEEEGQLLKLFVVESSTHEPDELIARFELFLESYVKDFESLIPEGRFENIKKELIITLSTPPPNLTDMRGQLYRLAFTHHGDFERIEKEIEAIKTLDYTTFKRDAITALSRDNKRRIAILLEGTPSQNKTPFRYQDITAETCKAKGPYIAKEF